MKLRCLILLAVVIVFAGCAADSLQTNHLRNLTDKQSDWFGRTAESWAFK